MVLRTAIERGGDVTHRATYPVSAMGHDPLDELNGPEQPRLRAIVAGGVDRGARSAGRRHGPTRMARQRVDPPCVPMNLCPHPDGSCVYETAGSDRLDGARQRLASTVLSFAESSDSSVRLTREARRRSILARRSKLQSATRQRQQWCRPSSKFDCPAPWISGRNITNVRPDG